MKLLIIGCGGHGRCCLEIAEAMNRYEEIAFLDDQHVHESIHGRKVIGNISEIETYGKQFDELFVAIGNNAFRKELQIKIGELGFHLATLIHPLSCISGYATIGEGSVVFPYACIENDASIGKGCILCSHVVVNHDAAIEDYCLIYANTTIRATAVIKEKVRIGSNCSISFGKTVETEKEIKDGNII